MDRLLWLLLICFNYYTFYKVISKSKTCGKEVWLCNCCLKRSAVGAEMDTGKAGNCVSFPVLCVVITPGGGIYA